MVGFPSIHNQNLRDLCLDHGTDNGWHSCTDNRAIEANSHVKGRAGSDQRYLQPKAGVVSLRLVRDNEIMGAGYPEFHVGRIHSCEI
jgi:hypothetical protein